jgi:hypothetical protein
MKLLKAVILKLTRQQVEPYVPTVAFYNHKVVRYQNYVLQMQTTGGYQLKV